MKRLLVVFAAVAALLSCGPAALAADGSPAAENLVFDRTGAWTDRCDAMPGEEIACRASFTVPGGIGYTARGEFGPGVECRLVTALRQNGRDVNSSFYTVVTRHGDAGDTLEIHFADAFSASALVRLGDRVYGASHRRSRLGRGDEPLCRDAHLR